MLPQPLSAPVAAGARILVVDDEPAIRDLLEDTLSFAGYRVSTVASGAAAISEVRSAAPDLVVLDVNLPDVDGFEVCRRLRAAGIPVPVIFLTAREDPEALRAGFAEGGDDYVAKPFRIEELGLRIAAVLRRSQRAAPPTAAPLVVGDLVIDVAAHEVTFAGAPVELSPTEFRLLEHLAEHTGLVRSKEQILSAVWVDGFGRDGSLVETNVSYLRRKLAAVGAADLVETVRGFGYKLVDAGAR